MEPMLSLLNSVYFLWLHINLQEVPEFSTERKPMGWCSHLRSKFLIGTFQNTPVKIVLGNRGSQNFTSLSQLPRDIFSKDAERTKGDSGHFAQNLFYIVVEHKCFFNVSFIKVQDYIFTWLLKSTNVMETKMEWEKLKKECDIEMVLFT